MKYILNETPVKTTNGFKINNISVDLDIPTVYKLNIINILCDEMNKIDISIDKVNKIESSKIGLEETLDYELNIIVKKYEELNKDCIIEYHFTDDANKLFSKINIKAEESSKSKFIIRFISDSDSYNFNYLKQINNLADNAKLDVSIVSNINELSDNLIAIENYVGENAYVNHNLYDLKGNKRISNYYTELATTSSENSLNNIYIGKNDSLIDMNYLTNLIGVKTRTNMITYGIHLTTDINLFEKVDKVFTASFDFPLPSSDDKAGQEEAKAISCGCPVKEKVEGASVRLDKKVIGRIDIAKAICSCAGDVTRVIVRKDAIVTQLAKDAASERNILIVTE